MRTSIGSPLPLPGVDPADAAEVGTLRPPAREARVSVGTVLSVNVSDGGVPKLSVPSARVTATGVEGDRQGDTEHHGGPEQTLCLFSAEVIEYWRAEGHPIQAGSVGENLTIADLDWSVLGPGAILRIGEQLVAEVTWPAAPCSKNAQWFHDGDYSRLSEKRHPGRSRWYAKVLKPGIVTAGDTVVLAAPANSDRSEPEH